MIGRGPDRTYWMPVVDGIEDPVTMFIALLIATFLTALAISHLVARFFKAPVGQIMSRLVTEDLGSAWERYVMFAIYVVGVSGGVRIREIERYITAQGEGQDPLILDASRWSLEIYRTVIQTAGSITWMLLVFFGFALVAYVLVRGAELRSKPTP